MWLTVNGLKCPMKERSRSVLSKGRLQGMAWTDLLSKSNTRSMDHIAGRRTRGRNTKGGCAIAQVGVGKEIN